MIAACEARGPLLAEAKAGLSDFLIQIVGKSKQALLPPDRVFANNNEAQSIGWSGSEHNEQEFAKLQLQAIRDVGTIIALSTSS